MIRNFSKFVTDTKFHYSLIFCGIVLRLKHFLEGRSLWLDESYVALGILDQSFKDIFSFKPFNETLALPPCLFLFFEKLSISVLGNHDFALRLFPLLAGISSLFLFYALLKRKVSPAVIPIALGLFAFNDWLVYYSCEVKQYSGDVFITLLLILVADWIKDKRVDHMLTIRLIYISVFAIFSSYSSIFILIGVGGYLLGITVREKKWFNLKYLLIAATICAAFFMHYYTSLEWMRTKPRFFESVAKAGFYTLHPILSAGHLKWYFSRFFSLFNNPGNLAPSIFWALIFTIGTIAVFRKKRETFFLLFTPFVLVCLAGFVLKFPFGGRFVLFLTPIIFIFIAEGAVAVIQKFSKGKTIAGAILIVLLFFNPLKVSAFNLFHSRDKSGIKPVMKVLKNHVRDGDLIYMNISSSWGYWYYFKSLKFDKMPIFTGKIIDSTLNKEASKFTFIEHYTPVPGQKGKTKVKGYRIASNQWPIDDAPAKRIWILLSHIRTPVREMILSALNSKGIPIKEYQTANSYLYLYHMEGNDSN